MNIAMFIMLLKLALFMICLFAWLVFIVMFGVMLYNRIKGKTLNE